MDGCAGRDRARSHHFLASCGCDFTAAGLTDFIASDHQHYVELAVNKANDLASLAQLRSALRDRTAATECGDPVRYARAVERHYRSMWQTWCSGRMTRTI